MHLLSLQSLLCAASCLTLLLLAPHGLHAIPLGEPCGTDDGDGLCDPGLICVPDEPYSNSTIGTCQDNCYDIVCLPLECQEGAEPGTQRPDKCCLDRSDCVCNSALCPAPPNCGSDSVPKVVAAADEANGQCCNKYVCKLVTCPITLPDGEDLVLQSGESRYRDDLCVTFTCTNGDLSFEEKICPELECSAQEEERNISGQCCPVCVPRKIVEPPAPEPECTQPVGRIFRDPVNQCMSCTCTPQGTKSCLPPTCDCTNPRSANDPCCPQCSAVSTEAPNQPETTIEAPTSSPTPIVDPFPQPECTQEGTFRDPMDPCKSCRCVRGVARCIDDTDRICGPAGCENPIRIPGLCCPVCPPVTTSTPEEPATTVTIPPETKFEIIVVLNLPVQEYFEMDVDLRQHAENLLATIGYQLLTISASGSRRAKTQLEMVIDITGEESSLTSEQLTALLTEELHAFINGRPKPTEEVTKTDFVRESTRDVTFLIIVGASSASVAVVITLIGIIIAAILITRHKRNRLAKVKEVKTKLDHV